MHCPKSLHLCYLLFPFPSAFSLCSKSDPPQVLLILAQLSPSQRGLPPTFPLPTPYNRLPSLHSPHPARLFPSQHGAPGAPEFLGCLVLLLERRLLGGGPLCQCSLLDASGWLGRLSPPVSSACTGVSVAPARLLLLGSSPSHLLYRILGVALSFWLWVRPGAEHYISQLTGYNMRWV